MNLIRTKVIDELISTNQALDGSSNIEHYIIPYFQRGYRWEDYHVKFLLNDIHNFMEANNRDNTNYYCLQPIVVAEGECIAKNLYQWELIDGQQRLITLNILFNVINKPNFKITFENRAKSTSFLKNISNTTLNHDSPDFHFMSVAYETILEWFKEKQAVDNDYLTKFYTTCCNHVKVIWYQIKCKDDNEKIEIFNRLNIGKIALTDAELIKALLLSEVKKGLSPREALLRQSDISSQWYNIETTLRDDELWGFLNISNDKYQSGRIELIFDLLAGSESTKYSTYLWLEERFKSEANDGYIQFWKEVNEIFTIIKSWYANRILYHYIGYLFAIEAITLSELLEKSRVKKTKSSFKQYLVNKIQYRISKFDLESWSYEYNRKDIERALLLFNVLSTISLTDIPQNRFSFKLYKDVSDNGGWSLEHIHAQNSENIKDENAMRTWLDDTKKSLIDIDTLVIKEDDYLDEVDSVVSENSEIDLRQVKYDLERMLQSEEINYTEFNELKDRISRKFDSKSIHELDNLALLGKRHNSVLQNAIFPVKRNKILELENKGAFIPPCTKNVFLKLYNNSNNQPFYWSSKDKESYFNSIKSVFAEFEAK